MKNKLVELWEFRELLFAITLREIKVRYKQTLLGATWAIIQPLSLMFIFTIVFDKFLKIGVEGVPYPLFSYSSLVPWTFFATSLSFGSLVVVNNSNLITKVYFPREVLPFAAIGAALLDFLISAIILIGLVLFYKVNITLNLIFVVPIILILIIFAASLILVLSALNVMWRDIKFVIPVLLQLWMFITPIIYPVSRVPEGIRSLYMLNPMASLVDNFRTVTALGKTPDLNQLSITLTESLLFFLAAYLFFKHKERTFADII